MGALADRDRSAPASQFECAAQRLASLRDSIRAAKRGAIVGQRPHVFKPVRRSLKHRHSLAQRVKPGFAWHEQPDHAKGAADSASGAPCARLLEFDLSRLPCFLDALLPGQRQRET